MSNPEVVDENGKVLNAKKALDSRFILAIIVYAAVGILLLVAPELVLRLICYISGGLCIGYGVIKIIGFLANRDLPVWHNLIVPIILTALGIFVIAGSDIVITVLPIVFGVLLLISGIMKFHKCFFVNTFTGRVPVGIIILSCISIVFGIIMIMHPFGTAVTFVRIEGVFFLIDVAFNLISYFMYRNK